MSLAFNPLYSAVGLTTSTCPNLCVSHSSFDGFHSSQIYGPSFQNSFNLEPHQFLLMCDQSWRQVSDQNGVSKNGEPVDPKKVPLWSVLDHPIWDVCGMKNLEKYQ